MLLLLFSNGVWTPGNTHIIFIKRIKSVDIPNVFLLILKCLLGYHPRTKTVSLLRKLISFSLLGYIQNEDEISLTFHTFFQLLEWEKTILFSSSLQTLFLK